MNENWREFRDYQTLIIKVIANFLLFITLSVKISQIMMKNCIWILKKKSFFSFHKIDNKNISILIILCYDCGDKTAYIAAFH